MAEGVTKLRTFSAVGPGATVHGWWNNANSEVYHLNAWPKVAAGVIASAELTRVFSVRHGSTSEKEVHFYVKNTGATSVDIEVWAYWWDWTLGPVLDSVRSEFRVPAVGGAIVTKDGIAALDVSGIRKHGSNVAVATTDRWHLGSDTKAMTATLVAVLAAKGQVSWDLTVAEAFPQWAQTMNSMFKGCTFHRLMAHRSGILNQTSAEQAALADGSVSVTERRRKFAQLITHRGHGAPGVIFDAPGVVYNYQNANFILAGAMLEKVTGKSWESLMMTEVFAPLGMTSAGFGAPGSVNDVNEPWGHSDLTGQRVPTKADNPPALGPAGTVHASLADWAKFIRLHLDGSEGGLSLSAVALTKLHTQHPTNNIYPNRYGWGWLFWDDATGLGLGHDGSNTLWYCSCQVLPQAGVAFLAVSNIGGGPNATGDDACWKIIEMIREKYFQS